MQTVTIRVPRREAGSGPFQIEWYFWNGDSLKGVRPKKVTAPPGLTGEKPAALKALKEVLHSRREIDDLRQRGRDLGKAIGGKNWAALEPDCRIYLCVEDPALREVPWELLETEDPFVLQKNRPLIRSSIKDLPRAPAMERRPLKVLILVGLGPEDDIGGREEADDLRRLFWGVDHSFDCVVVDALDVQDPQKSPLSKPADLTKLLEKHTPDIFHFIGHGSASSLEIFDAGKGNNGKTWDWKDSDVRLALRNSSAIPRVAYLNACRSQQDQGGPLDHVSVAKAFLDGGTLAAISMQADIEASAAHESARGFYETLITGLPIDAAMQAARGALDAKVKDPYLPVLTVRAAAETILPQRGDLDAGRSRALSECKHLGSLKTFVDRHADRRTLIRNFLRSDTAAPQRYSAAIVKGGSKTGKTWFCWWWIRMCAWQRLPAYYVVPPEPKDLKNLDWLEYIRRIGEGNVALGALSPGLPADVFRQFNWELEQIHQGKESPFTTAPANFKDPRRPRQEILDGHRAGNDFPQKALTCFHDALKRAAGSETLVLVCDEWLGNLGLGPSDVTTLKTYLFDPIAENPRGPVRVIVALPDAGDAGPEANDRKDPFREVQFGVAWHKVIINDFDLSDIRELLTEYMERYHPLKSTEAIASWTPSPKPIAPDKLVEFAELLAAAVGPRKSRTGAVR